MSYDPWPDTAVRHHPCGEPTVHWRPAPVCREIRASHRKRRWLAIVGFAMVALAVAAAAWMLQQVVQP